MQTLAAYLIFLLVIVAVGLGIVFIAVMALAAYEGMEWMKSSPAFRVFERSAFEIVSRGRSWIERELHGLREAVRVRLHVQH
jgi:hypothetical protein